jgi:hypothetical protein
MFFGGVESEADLTRARRKRQIGRSDGFFLRKGAVATWGMRAGGRDMILFFDFPKLSAHCKIRQSLHSLLPANARRQSSTAPYRLEH